MALRRIDVHQAYAALREEKGAVYLDVRTEEEFAQGHPDGALNVPVGHPNPATRVLEANPRFLDVARAVLPREVPVIIGCRTGPRAETAAQILAADGYRDVRWVYGGYVGMTDPFGNKLAPGWLESGLPVSRDQGEGFGYESLRKKAGL